MATEDAIERAHCEARHAATNDQNALVLRCGWRMAPFKNELVVRLGEVEVGSVCERHVLCVEEDVLLT